MSKKELDGERTRQRIPKDPHGALYASSGTTFLRRVLLSYYFIAALVIGVCILMKMVLKIAFTVIAPDANDVVTLGDALELWAMFTLVLIYGFIFLASGLVLLRSAASGRELLELKRFSFSVALPPGRAPGCWQWDLVVQILVHLGVELLPLLVGLYGGLIDGSLGTFIGFWLFGAAYAALGITLLFGCLSTLRYLLHFFTTFGCALLCADYRRRSGLKYWKERPGCQRRLLMPCVAFLRCCFLDYDDLAEELARVERQQQEAAGAEVAAGAAQPTQLGIADAGDDDVDDDDDDEGDDDVDDEEAGDCERERDLDGNIIGDDDDGWLSSIGDNEAVLLKEFGGVRSVKRTLRRGAELGITSGSVATIGSVNSATGGHGRTISPTGLVRRVYYPKSVRSVAKHNFFRFATDVPDEPEPCPCCQRTCLRPCCLATRECFGAPTDRKPVPCCPVPACHGQRNICFQVFRLRFINHQAVAVAVLVALVLFGALYLQARLSSGAAAGVATVVLILALILMRLQQVVGICCPSKADDYRVCYVVRRRQISANIDCCAVSVGALAYVAGLAMVVGGVALQVGSMSMGGMIVAVLASILFATTADDIQHSDTSRLRRRAVVGRVQKRVYNCCGLKVYRYLVAHAMRFSLLVVVFVTMVVSGSVKADTDIATQDLALALVLLTVGLLVLRLRRMSVGPSSVTSTLTRAGKAAALKALVDPVPEQSAASGERVVANPLQGLAPGGVVELESHRGGPTEKAKPQPRDLEDPAAPAATTKAFDPVADISDEQQMARRLVHVAARGKGFHSTSVIGITLGIVFVLMFLLILTLANSVSAPPTNCRIDGDATRELPGEFPYPSCGERFLNNRMGLTDATFMANLAYMTPGLALNTSLGAWFSQSEGWSVAHSSPDEGNVFFHAIERAPAPGASPDWITPGPHTWPAAQLPVDGCPECTLLVLAVRGTTTGIDAVKDVDVWLEASLLQGTMEQMPGFNFVSNNVTAGWVKLMNALDLSDAAKLDGYWKPAVDFVYKRYPSARPENGGTINGKPLRQSVLVVGHSLGGGLAKIIAAKLGVRAVSVSGPGLRLTRAKFDISERLLDETGLNIVPDGDPVPMVDAQRGATQHILCDVRLAECHSLVRTTHTLLRSCGDPEGRTVFEPEDDCG